MKRNSMANSTGKHHSPRNGDIVNGLVYDRKYAFERDDKYQLIDKAYNPSYNLYQEQIINTLIKRMEKHSDDPSYKREVINYLKNKENNFIRKNLNTNLKSPINKFKELLNNKMTNSILFKKEKNQSITKNNITPKIVHSGKKNRNIINIQHVENLYITL